VLRVGANQRSQASIARASRTSGSSGGPSHATLASSVPLGAATSWASRLRSAADVARSLGDASAGGSVMAPRPARGAAPRGSPRRRDHRRQARRRWRFAGRGRSPRSDTPRRRPRCTRPRARPGAGRRRGRSRRRACQRGVDTRGRLVERPWFDAPAARPPQGTLRTTSTTSTPSRIASKSNVALPQPCSARRRDSIIASSAIGSSASARPLASIAVASRSMASRRPSCTPHSAQNSCQVSGASWSQVARSAAKNAHGTSTTRRSIGSRRTPLAPSSGASSRCDTATRPGPRSERGGRSRGG
jgi:hypothetical protein